MSRKLCLLCIAACAACLSGLLLASAGAHASEQQKLSVGSTEQSLAAWREIPILEDGRVMPLDTFARRRVEAICHTHAPKLLMPASVSSESAATVVQWHADELLLDWLVRPEAWQEVPFLIAEHEELRKLLELPIFEESTAGRRRLKYAAPADVIDSEPLRKRLIDIDERRREARQAGRPFQLEGVDAKIDQLWQAFAGWRQLTFRATADQVGRSRFLELFDRLAASWKQVRLQLAPGERIANPSNQLTAVDAALVALAESLGQSTHFSTESALQKVQQTRESLEAVDASAVNESAAVRRSLRRFSDRLTVLAESLYDNGGGLLVVPAFHAEALETERSAEEDMPPWLALSTLLDAPEAILIGYPSAQIQAVRESFLRLSAAICTPLTAPRESFDRNAAMLLAANSFALALRTLGETAEPLRQTLPVERADAHLLRYTAYPAAGSTQLEVAYNLNDPFKWSWVLSFLALGAFALAFGKARGPMFWLASALLIAELGWTAAAFAFRVAITGWAPVTNMYETVIYVPFFLSLLGIFFLLAPACHRGVGDAWRLTALPLPLGNTFIREAVPLDGRQLSLLTSQGWNGLNWLLLGPRLLISALVIWVLAMAPYAAGGRTIINLLPQTDIDRSIPNLNNLVVWVVGLCMLLPAVWYLPRVALTAIVSTLTLPLSWFGGYLRQQLPEVYERRAFGLVVTAVAFAGTFIAWFFPIPGKQFSPLQPVLRDNFWLTIHVLTIVSSYAAGALAWGLGTLSLGYFLLGKYRVASSAGGAKTPPEACAALAGFIYKAMQVAVLLLAAGTILGGLWADVSWGRFWGWDPKEVWALVSLLAYLVILHGRYAGWIGNFGLAAGSVLGAAVIGMSWYGVNFLLGAGLHSYGFGKGGQTEFFTFLVANFLLLAAAAWRWKRETATG